MAELAGQFAGIVVVSVPAEHADELRAPGGLELDIAAHPGSEEPAGVEGWRRLRIDLVGSDHPGIVRDVSAVLARHGSASRR